MRIVYFWSVLCVAACMCGNAVELVENNVARAVIVIPDDALDPVKHAARELAYHVRKATGAELPILAESRASDNKSPKIYLGKVRALPGDVPWDQLNRNGFYYEATPDALFIVGRDSNAPWNCLVAESGTLQGVYYWLDRTLGVRWLWPGETGEVIPHTDQISVGEEKLTFRQPIESSRIHPSFRIAAGWNDPKAFQTFTDNEILWECRNGFSWNTPWRAQHSFGLWKYWDRFGQKHPEFFNLLPDGTRRPDPYHVAGGSGDYVSTCPSSPGLARQVVEDWKQNRGKGFPWGPELYLGEDDTSGSCCCENCLALDRSDLVDRQEKARKAFIAGDRNWPEALGDVSRRYIHFYREVLKLAREVDPDVKVIGWANYANFRKAPQEHLGSDFILAFVSPLMYPWTPEKVAESEESFQEWGKTGAGLILRPNFMLDGHDMPIVFDLQLADFYQFCLKHNMVGVEFDSNTGQYASNGFNMYMLARLIRRPDLTGEEILMEFCSAFGAAAPEIREYHDYWEKISQGPQTSEAYRQAVEAKIGVESGYYNRFFVIAPLIYTPEVLAAGEAILDRAAAKVTDDPAASARIEFLRKGLQHAMLTAAAQRAYDSGDRFALMEAVQDLDGFRNREERNGIANMAFLTQQENGVWDRSQLQFMRNAPGTPLPDIWSFRWDPQDIGLQQRWYAPETPGEWQSIGIDSCWEDQAVGKEWKTEHGTDYNGFAWYRNSFLIPRPEPGESVKVILTFGAVDEACKVWLNGKWLLDRPFPFEGNPNSWREPFSLDVTEAVRFGEDNLLTVRVSDRAGAGGIWRPVWFRIETRETRPNLLSNGDFENGLQDWNSHVNAGTFHFGTDSEEAASGKQCGLIQCTAKAPDGTDLWSRAFGRFYRDIPVTAGKTYRLQAKIKTQPDFSGNVRIWCISGDKRRDGVYGGTGGLWLPVEIDDIQAGDNKLGLLLNVTDGIGKVWFDDLILTEIPGK